MRVHKRIQFAKYWLPVLLWFALIFAASGDAKSAHHSSRIIGPIVHWLLPRLAAAQVDEVVFYARKGAHVTEYAVLAWLFWRAFRHHAGLGRGNWSAAVARRAWLAATAYAVTDELHQFFVPNRQGTVLDVLVDSFGAALGLAIIWSIGRWRRKW